MNLTNLKTACISKNVVSQIFFSDFLFCFVSRLLVYLPDVPSVLKCHA